MKHRQKIANVIKSERKKRKLTQQALANIIGISKNTIGHIETGKHGVSVDTLATIMDYFDISMEDLTNDTKVEPTALTAFNLLSEENKKIITAHMIELLSKQ